MVTSLLNALNEKCNHPDLAKLILRLSIGMLLFHGFHKLMSGVGGIGAMLVAHGVPEFVSYGVYIGEIVAPILIILGILCRPCAIVVFGTMVVAWLLVDVDATFAVDKVGAWAIESLMFYALMALVVLFVGTGRYSVVSEKWR
ncbi:DoxX family protein [Celerinatantimonas sp. MCCC 1A17872]|uniref:DoxX family protein n=1 Tax=Celerinatantimonas sp. MCCC 1A17872 TaxID=3177514 RepID=UPI0038C8456D